ncbi:MAG: GcrA family cell cycle regulator [Hyphomicrobiales bacterium]
MSWTDERVELLKKLWTEGLSASQIAGRLGGVTRNAVIGKVHRLGLSGRTTTSRVKAPRPRRTAPRPNRVQTTSFRTIGNVALKPRYEADAEAEVDYRPAPAIIEELVIPVAERATILTLKECMCRWPIGDPGEADFHFCGREAASGAPYCEHHSRVAYQPVQPRRRDRRAEG